ncbi:MAG: hypothetical protein K2W96_15215 [Gemmataceae bacterium]|nr:hypothetical protein [Gemmataceae bacterium]
MARSNLEELAEEFKQHVRASSRDSLTQWESAFRMRCHNSGISIDEVLRRQEREELALCVRGNGLVTEAFPVLMFDKGLRKCILWMFLQLVKPDSHLAEDLTSGFIIKLLKNRFGDYDGQHKVSSYLLPGVYRFVIDKVWRGQAQPEPLTEEMFPECHDDPATPLEIAEVIQFVGEMGGTEGEVLRGFIAGQTAAEIAVELEIPVHRVYAMRGQGWELLRARFPHLPQPLRNQPRVRDQPQEQHSCSST